MFKSLSLCNKVSSLLFSLSLCLCLLLSKYNIYVMEWSGRRTRQDTGSGVSKNGDHSRRTAIRFYSTAADNFQHPKSSLARIDKRTAVWRPCGVTLHAALQQKRRAEKIRSLSVSLSFPKGSNCSVFSIFIPLFPRFLFPLGARSFSVKSDTFFLSLGRSLNGTFLVTPVYLHRGTPLLCRVGVAKN